MTWREFSSLVAGLLAADTRLARHFREEAEPSPEGVPHE